MATVNSITTLLSIMIFRMSSVF